ncbi:hypothetical protein BG011_006765 [Mortierella polycephala]|uniref:Protein kinase domain-containing protein n=1 Tax=Mortierella polycephala TaxID=41804 RepID=A0A9P6QFB1_9FUNG|nr:hypothetical protein BG011_006765 [Mortierella polycephala]
MSSITSNTSTLNRRASIHSGARATQLQQEQQEQQTPTRQFSTFEIEVEYISTNQLPLRGPSYRDSISTLTDTTEICLDKNEDDMHLESVLEEEEEEEEDGKEDKSQISQSLLPPRSTRRPYPASLPRQWPMRPQSQQFLPQSWQRQQLQPDDQFANIYQPSFEAGPSRMAVPNGGTARHSVGGYHVHTSIAHSEYLQSSHVQHDSTPVLSSAGSQSDDEEEEEEGELSPVECLELIDDEEEEEDKVQVLPEQNSSVQSGLPRSPSRRRNASDMPELETQDTLRRERTRILERTVVSSYRQIDFKDISNIQPLKKGGYGEIHTAEWSRLRVVLKRALPEHSEGVEQFEQELEILKRVHDYDFIVPFYGVTTDPQTNVNCMVMKHCTNGNLCTFLEENHENLTWMERYRLSIEITKGLEFLHKSGFHHRDLHSGNILLDDKRTAMICDFGLSRSSTKDQTTDIASTVGVASFLAPERFPRKRPIYSASCDIYSLGVIFWHISSGRIPFARRLREPMLLRELMDGLREEIAPGTPTEYRDMLVKCWDKKPSKRLKIDVVIAILQTLMAKPTEPIHQIATGFAVPSDTTSASLPVPPELHVRMAGLERASNTLNKMVFDIQEPIMRETSPMDTIKILVELGADINLENLQGYTPVMILVSSNTQYCYEALRFFVMRGARIPAYIRNPITPMNSAQIYALNLVNGSRQIVLEDSQELIPAAAVGVGTGMSAPLSQQEHRYSPQRISVQNQNVFQERGGHKVKRLFAQGRPLIHVVAAMQEDYRILDCLCEAGLDPAISFGGETALVAAAAHLRIKNVEWLLNHDLDISTESGVQRAIKVVKIAHQTPLSGTSPYTSGGGHGKSLNSSAALGGRLSFHTLANTHKDYPEGDIRALGKYSWAGVSCKYGDVDRVSKDMVGPVLNLLEQWTGSRRISNRKEVATKLKVMYGSSMDPSTNLGGVGSMASMVSIASTNSNNSMSSQGSYPPQSNPQQHSQQPQPQQHQHQQLYQHQHHQHPIARSGLIHGTRSMRKSQRHLIDEVLNDRKSTMRFWS